MLVLFRIYGKLTLEIFIKGGMTSVGQAVLTGSGKIGASFGEAPSVGMPRVERIRKRLDISVSEGRVGMIVAGD